MKSWLAAAVWRRRSGPAAGSRLYHAPEWPALSRTVIWPPGLTGAALIGAAPGLGPLPGLPLPLLPLPLLLLLPPPLLLPPLPPAASAAAAIPRQAVRADRSRIPTSLTYPRGPPAGI
jgi:hypothetical protein